MATNVSVTVLPTTNSIPLPSNSFVPTFTGPPASTQTGGGSQGVNYFFGFLIAFIALLLFFVGCGFGARRSMMRNRRLHQRLNDTGMVFGNASVDGLLLRNRETLKEPVFWERPFQKGISQWELMMPLTATIVTEGVATSNPGRPSSSSPPATLGRNWQTPSEARLQSRFFFMPFTFFVFPSPRLRRERTAGGSLSLGSVSRTSSRHSLPTSIRAHQSTSSTDVPSSIPVADENGTVLPEKKLVPEASSKNLQIVVIIAMPSQHHNDDPKQVRDLQLGIKRVPVLGIEGI